MSSPYESPQSEPTSPAPSRHREVTISSVVFGLIIGAVMNASFTYAALKLGFGIGGSTIAAILGFGVLRGILRRGTILETNIAQTVASAVNIPNAGVVFTVPVLFMLNHELNLGYDLSITSSNFWMIGLACVVGSVLGCAFIIPLRKQMIDIDRLRFPTGTAVAEILKSPGAGASKSVVLLIGCLIGTAIYLPVALSDIQVAVTDENPTGSFWGLSQLGINSSVDQDGDGKLDPIVSDKSVDVGLALGIPREILLLFALSPLSLGAGFVSGRAGLMVLAGGVLAYLVLNPIAYNYLALMPATVEPQQVANFGRATFNRPLGIGMLVGGAMMGVLFSLPAMRAALKSISNVKKLSGGSDELGIRPLVVAIVVGIVGLFMATMHLSGGTENLGLLGGLPPMVASLITTLLCGVWIWFAGIIIAQCTGMTDWSPISGIALLTVVLAMFLGGQGNILGAVMIGAALCVSVCCAADMIQDLKTGHLVGASPKRQQTIELAVTGIGPIISLCVLLLIAQKNIDDVGKPFGEGTSMPAPQAEALKGIVMGVSGGKIAKAETADAPQANEAVEEPVKPMPYALYGLGSVVGIALGFGGFPGLGVLVGLSMYLPIHYILTYGIGGIAYLIFTRVKGKIWVESWGIPFCAGLIVGEAVTSLTVSAIILARG